MEVGPQVLATVKYRVQTCCFDHFALWPPQHWLRLALCVIGNNAADSRVVGFANREIYDAITQSDKFWICAQLHCPVEFGCPLEEKMAGIRSWGANRLPVRVIAGRQVSYLVIVDSRDSRKLPLQLFPYFRGFGGVIQS